MGRAQAGDHRHLCRSWVCDAFRMRRSSQWKEKPMADRVRATYLRYSDHAVCQARERGSPGDLIPYVVAHGKRYHFNGGEWYHLRRRDIASTDRTRYERYAGVAVLIAQ